MSNVLNKEKLSHHQKRVVRLLERHQGQLIASVQDVADRLNFAGKSTAWRVLDYLQRKEWVSVTSLGKKKKAVIKLMKPYQPEKVA